MCSLELSVVKNYVSFFFFFSSRRRHTRWTGDWSSDVCSSDLERERRVRDLATDEGQDVTGEKRRRADRSEERRVGKECRSRRSPDHEKKKKVLVARKVHNEDQDNHY